MEKYESERVENRQRICESIIKSLGYFPEWTILEEMDPLNNIGLN